MISINLADRKLTPEYYIGVLNACAGMLELRSNETGEQCNRVERLAERIGRALKLSTPQLRDLVCGAAVHDIGKTGVVDAILHKPGALTAEERVQMEKHVEYGVKTLRRFRIPEGIVVIAAQHHERMDGKGYPAGLRGESISLSVRIFTVCDAYDAMVSDRCYRKGRSHEEATKELVRCMGDQFDPEVVKIFMTFDESELVDFEKVSWQ